jgi:hypothetical protein
MAEVLAFSSFRASMRIGITFSICLSIFQSAQSRLYLNNTFVLPITFWSFGTADLASGPVSRKPWKCQKKQPAVNC